MLSIKIYENQFFRSDFTPIYVCLFRLYFLTTLNIYKDYFKGYCWCNLMQKIFTSILWIGDICPSSSFSWRSCCICTLLGFVTKEICHLHCIDKLMNWRTLQQTTFLSWWLSCILGSTHLLISHVLGAVHCKGEIVTIE